VAYRVNDYRGLRSDPGAVAYVIGKSQVVEKIPSGHPIVYGPGIPSHPSEATFWDKAEIRLILVSCVWLKAMYDRDLSCSIHTAIWPAGIETDLWFPSTLAFKGNKVLVYDKVRWDRDYYELELMQAVFKTLKSAGLEPVYFRYGSYDEGHYRKALDEVRAMVFLCEHETQGFAYLQALSCDVPILAWERQGFWQDPEYYPHKVKFSPVSAVPYWDDRCGMKFKRASDFPTLFAEFWNGVQGGCYRPRDYILQNLTLQKCTANYIKITEELPLCIASTES
jgi:hypothetical protein